jgi:hypothetical protein
MAGRLTMWPGERKGVGAGGGVGVARVGAEMAATDQTITSIFRSKLACWCAWPGKSMENILCRVFTVGKLILRGAVFLFCKKIHCKNF